MTKAKRVAVLEEMNERLEQERDVCAWLLNAADDVDIPRAHLNAAIADHVHELQQLSRMAKSL